MLQPLRAVVPSDGDADVDADVETDVSMSPVWRSTLHSRDDEAPQESAPRVISIGQSSDQGCAIKIKTKITYHGLVKYIK